ncbi:MAG: type IV pili methyl-accepting chemotaxis transducer N-terminal domain-containing protein [Candidatus Brocadiales bacterium]
MKRFGICLILVLVSFVFGNICWVISAGAVDYGNIINLAGKQRMLTQKMSKEILLITFKMEESKNKEDLKNTSALFERTLNGLINGDEGLKLEPCGSEDIKAQLQKVKSMWEGFKPFVEEAITAEKVSTTTLKKVAEQNVPLLKEMNKAVKMYEVEAEKATGKKAGVVINLAGRQRMFTQKMTKELLLVARKVDPDKNKQELKKTADLFGRTLKGLINGDAELGLPATTNKDILAQLKKVQSLWKDFKPAVYETALTGKAPADALRKVMKLNIPLLKEMNKVVQMY